MSKKFPKQSHKRRFDTKQTQTVANTNHQAKMVHSIPDIVKKAHELIRHDPKEAQRYLKRAMTKDVRLRVASEPLAGETCLSLAVEVGDPNLVSYLLDKCGCNVDMFWIGELAWDGTKSKAEYTPLMKSVVRGNVKVAKVLLEQGADVDAVNDQGFSALHGACAMGDVNMVEYLLSAKAKVNLKTKQGTTCLMNARRSPEIREMLLDAGAQMSQVNVFGRTALHQAAMEGCLRSVCHLLDKRADIFATDTKKNTVLHLAVYNQHIDVVRELVKRGADLYSRNSSMEDVFLMAAASNNQDMTTALLEAHRRKTGKSDTREIPEKLGTREIPEKSDTREIPEKSDTREIPEKSDIREIPENEKSDTSDSD